MEDFEGGWVNVFHSLPNFRNKLNLACYRLSQTLVFGEHAVYVEEEIDAFF